MTGAEIGALSAICIAAFATLGLQAWRCASSLNKSSDRDELTITIGTFEKNGENIKLTNLKIQIEENDSKYFKDRSNKTNIGSESVSLAFAASRNKITSSSISSPATIQNVSQNSSSLNLSPNSLEEEKAESFDGAKGRPGDTHLVMDNAIPVQRMTTNIVNLITSSIPDSNNVSNNESTPQLMGEGKIDGDSNV